MLSEAVRPELPAKLQALYPFLTRTFPVDGLRLSFAEAGPSDAPPLVLLHGSPTWSFLFRDAIVHASEKFRVIAPDHIGFGLSDKPKAHGYHTLERHILNFSALIAELKLERVTLVLHEWGGPIGLGWATRFPEKVEQSC